MNEYLEKNSIILPNHHGGLKGHSTVTARAVINMACTQAIDKNKFCIVVSTDQLTSYNTADHNLMIPVRRI